MEDFIEGLVKVVGVIIVAIGTLMFISILMCFPLMWSWNYVMPYLFGFKCLSWGQAWCLSFCAGVLLKSSVTSK